MFMSVELYRESPGKFDSRTPSRKTLNRWTGRISSSVVVIITIVSNIMIVRTLSRETLSRWTGRMAKYMFSRELTKHN